MATFVSIPKDFSQFYVHSTTFIKVKGVAQLSNCFTCVSASVAYSRISKTRFVTEKNNRNPKKDFHFNSFVLFGFLKSTS